MDVVRDSYKLDCLLYRRKDNKLATFLDLI